MIVPEGGGGGRAGVEFVAVCGDDERIGRVRAPANDDQADTKRSSLRCTPSFAPSRSSAASKLASFFTPS